MQPSYKNAFRCRKCPQSNGPDGCPAWMEITMTNDAKDIQVSKDCSYQLMPLLLVKSITAANRPAEEISAMRGEMINKVKEVLEGPLALAFTKRLDP